MAQTNSVKVAVNTLEIFSTGNTASLKT